MLRAQRGTLYSTSQHSNTWSSDEKLVRTGVGCGVGGGVGDGLELSVEPSIPPVNTVTCGGQMEIKLMKK